MFWSSFVPHRQVLVLLQVLGKYHHKSYREPRLYRYGKIVAPGVMYFTSGKILKGIQSSFLRLRAAVSKIVSTVLLSSTSLSLRFLFVANSDPNTRPLALDILWLGPYCAICNICSNSGWIWMVCWRVGAICCVCYYSRCSTALVKNFGSSLLMMW